MSDHCPHQDRNLDSRPKSTWTLWVYEADDKEILSICPQCSHRVSIDGYCQQCGLKAPLIRDHYEVGDGVSVHAVTDRGRRHSANEDAIAAGKDMSTSSAFIIVADGVSSAPGSATAALAAVEAAGQSMMRSLQDEEEGSSAARKAVDQANEAIQALDSYPTCSSTIAIGWYHKGYIHSATIGDSRVYWIADGSSPQMVSRDDSLAQEAIESGADPSETYHGSCAHVITRWLGADAPDLKPTYRCHQLSTSGWLMVCSDGLWNEFSDDMQGISLTVDEPIRTLLTSWVDWVNSRGGKDNISVGLIRVSFDDELRK